MKHTVIALDTEVEVFKTGVNNLQEAERLFQLLTYKYPNARITFDMEDCDKILRVEGRNIDVDHVKQLLNQEGVYCQVLE